MIITNVFMPYKRASEFSKRETEAERKRLAEEEVAWTEVTEVICECNSITTYAFHYKKSFLYNYKA